jgi:hypothetical protein
MKKYIWLGLAVIVLGLSGCTLVKYNNNNSATNNTVDNQVVDTSTDEAAIKQLFVTQYPTETDRPEVKIEKLVGSTARGSLTFKDESGTPASGAYFFAAKENGAWKIVLSGNGQISCATLAPYNFPADMITDCVTQ